MSVNRLVDWRRHVWPASSAQADWIRMALRFWPDLRVFWNERIPLPRRGRMAAYQRQRFKERWQLYYRGRSRVTTLAKVADGTVHLVRRPLVYVTTIEDEDGAYRDFDQRALWWLIDNDTWAKFGGRTVAKTVERMDVAMEKAHASMVDRKEAAYGEMAYDYALENHREIRDDLKREAARQGFSV